MRMALAEAVKALGRTSPNPLVGAVVVKDGRVVGRGYHKRAGTAHAEVNALADAGEFAKGATIYVTLEPCNHQGRTGPCSLAILNSGISRVVVGMADPNPSVTGGGNAFLEQQGVEVHCGVLEDECRAINRPFIKWVTQRQPWVILKAGLSLDGRIAPPSREQLWITNEVSRAHVHLVRDQVDAILVGIGTALADSPSLTTRIKGRVDVKDPLRVILDTHLRLDPNSHLITQASKARTLLFCGEKVSDDRILAYPPSLVDIERVQSGSNGQMDLKMVLGSLAERGVTSVLVEGGSRVHASFICNGLADQAMLFYGPVFLGELGVPLFNSEGMHFETFPRLKSVSSKQFGSDVLIEGFF